jgi:hypothetical protein
MSPNSAAMASAISNNSSWGRAPAAGAARRARRRHHGAPRRGREMSGAGGERLDRQSAEMVLKTRHCAATRLPGCRDRTEPARATAAHETRWRPCPRVITSRMTEVSPCRARG